MSTVRPLARKVALVTSACEIGLAIARAFVRQGADIAIGYESRKKDRAGEVIEAAKEIGVHARGYEVCVSDQESAEKMVAAVTNDLGPVSILVNSAGITRDKTFVRMSREMWDAVINTNLGSIYNVTHAVLPSMMDLDWGRIVNISSIVGQWGNFGQANFAAAMAGVIGFTKALSRELARRNITVNSVASGFIEDEMTKDLPEAVKMQVTALTPMNRMGKPEEVAAAVTLFTSPDASYITGQVLGVNGGMYM